MKPVSHLRGSPEKLALGITSVLGLSFWFFLGFPFANRLESYVWIVQLNRLGLLDALTQTLEPVANFRPLSTATAWLGYRLSGGSIYPQQVLNYSIAVLAWLVVFLAIKEKKLFSCIALIVGGFFFPGYIYLFHLHGVFFSPLLLLVAFLVAIAMYEDTKNNTMLVTASILAILVSFYHPFALLTYIAFVPGLFLDNISRGGFQAITRKRLAIAGSFCILALGLIRVLVPNQNLLLRNEVMLGLLTSYKMVELDSLVSIVAFLLSIITVSGLNTSLRVRATLSVIIALLSFVFHLAAQPVMVVWIFTCLLKMVLMHKWPIAFLIVSTSMFPAITATGSPTYTVFVLMICAAAVPLGWSALEKRLFFVDNRFTLILSIIVISIVCLLRYGVRIPIISELANPIPAEREKTFQLENVIRWKMESSYYREYELVLCQPAKNPAASPNAIASAMERKHRAPTYQECLDAYIASIRMPRHEESSHRLLACFGNESISNAQAVYVVQGKYNGDAIVYKPYK